MQGFPQQPSLAAHSIPFHLIIYWLPCIKRIIHSHRYINYLSLSLRIVALINQTEELVLRRPLVTIRFAVTLQRGNRRFPVGIPVGSCEAKRVE